MTLKFLTAIALLALGVAACSGDDAETSTASSTSTTTTTAVEAAAWTPTQVDDLVALCVQDAGNRSNRFPEIDFYSPQEAPERCAEDVDLLELNGCSVTKAALLLTDWDADKSPYQCPSD